MEPSPGIKTSGFWSLTEFICQLGQFLVDLFKLGFLLPLGVWGLGNCEEEKKESFIIKCPLCTESCTGFSETLCHIFIYLFIFEMSLILLPRLLSYSLAQMIIVPQFPQQLGL